MEERKPQIPRPEDLVEERKPTSLLIAQFFLFPLIIIAICVGIFVLFGYLTHEQRSPNELLNEIRTGSQSRRWQAATELATIVSSNPESLRNARFVEDVLTLYDNSKDDDPQVRLYLAITLGRLGDRSAVPALVEGLNDAAVENRIFTLWALGSIGDNAAVPGVAGQLRHEDPAIRKTAAYVLGVLGDANASRDLQIALNDPQDEVRWNAAMALARLNDASGAGLLMELLDPGYLEAREELTAEMRAEFQINAIKCLALLQYGPAHEKIAAIGRDDPNLAVRDAALEALKSF